MLFQLVLPLLALADSESSSNVGATSRQSSDIGGATSRQSSDIGGATSRQSDSYGAPYAPPQQYQVNMIPPQQNKVNALANCTFQPLLHSALRLCPPAPQNISKVAHIFYLPPPPPPPLLLPPHSPYSGKCIQVVLHVKFLYQSYCPTKNFSETLILLLKARPSYDSYSAPSYQAPTYQAINYQTN